MSRVLGCAHPDFCCSCFASHEKGKTKYKSYPLVLNGGYSPENSGVQNFLNYIEGKADSSSETNTT